MDMWNKFTGYVSFQVRQSRSLLSKTTGISVSRPLTARTLTELYSAEASDTKHQVEWVCNHKWQMVLAPVVRPVVFTLQHFSSQSVSPISAPQLADVCGGFIYLSKGKLKWKCSETFWFPDEKKKNKSAEELLSGKRSKLCQNKSFFFFFHRTAFCPRLKPSRPDIFPGKIRSCILLYSTIYHHGLRKMSGALSVDRWGFYLCTPLSDNIRALADLCRAQQGFLSACKIHPWKENGAFYFSREPSANKEDARRRKQLALKGENET